MSWQKEILSLAEAPFEYVGRDPLKQKENSEWFEDLQLSNPGLHKLNLCPATFRSGI